MNKEVYDIISLIIQLFIAVGTISAVIVALWQSRSSLRENAILSVSVGVPKNNLMHNFHEYDNKPLDKIILINITNIAIRTIHIHHLSLENIFTGKGFHIPIKYGAKPILSGDNVNMECALARLLTSEYIKYLKSHFFYRFFIRFTVTTKTGRKFYSKIPTYLCKMIKAEKLNNS